MSKEGEGWGNSLLQKQCIVLAQLTLQAPIACLGEGRCRVPQACHAPFFFCLTLCLLMGSHQGRCVGMSSPRSLLVRLKAPWPLLHPGACCLPLLLLLWAKIGDGSWECPENRTHGPSLFLSTLSRTPSLCLSRVLAYGLTVRRRWLMQMLQIHRMEAARWWARKQPTGSHFSQLLAISWHSTALVLST